MSQYTIIYKYGKRKNYLGGVFNKAIIPLALVGYEMIIANSALRASLAMIISYPTRARGITDIVVIDWKTSSAC